MTRKNRYWILLPACCIAAGCISLEPKPDLSKFFSLTSLPRAGERAHDAGEAAKLSVGIGPIKIPGYLDREQFVTRVSQNRFAVAENDRWAEPLDENISRVLSQDLSILLQTDKVVTFPWERSQQPKYQVQVELLRFEPDSKQVVELWARWSIVDSTKKTLGVKESYFSHAMKDKSTDAAVAAMSETMNDLSREIAAAIRALSGQNTQASALGSYSRTNRSGINVC